MKMSLKEKSECFRGFLLLIAQDRKVSDEERHLLRHIGKALDFESRFCEEAMNELLENEYIATYPPVFSRREHAEAFLRDCIRIATADNELHAAETAWLTQVAQANGIAAAWLDDAVRESTAGNADADTRRMEIEEFA